MRGGHQLQNHPLNPLLSSSKHVNHPVIIGRRTAWSPWDVNATSHIPNSNWSRVSMPVPSSTRSSSDSQYDCIWSSKVHSSSCGPSGPMSPIGKCGIYPEATTPRVTRREVIQGLEPGIHQLWQPHTCRTHPAHIWWPWDHITHRNRREWSKY